MKEALVDEKLVATVMLLSGVTAISMTSVPRFTVDSINRLFIAEVVSQLTAQGALD